MTIAPRSRPGLRAALPALLAALALSPLSSLAQGHTGHGAGHGHLHGTPEHAGHAGHAGQASAPAAASAAASDSWAEGEVRRIDRAGRKITLRHGDIQSLNMPPMTMVFQVDDATLLDRASVGAKVRFKADQEGGRYRVTDLQALQP